MQPEIEAKFLAVDHDALRARLQALGAECVQPDRLMKRKNYDFRMAGCDKSTMAGPASAMRATK